MNAWEAEVAGQLGRAFDELMASGLVRAGSLVVLGCSTSEVGGGRIGKNIQAGTGEALAEAALAAAERHGLRLAVQCCEHLNRSLVVERETLERLSLTEVRAVPKPTAGGSCAAAAWLRMRDPALAETVRADAGIDVGDTFIGMHLKRVAVPVRISFDQIGKAHLTLAATRPPYTGGPRAQYE